MSVKWQKVRLGDVAIGIYDGPHATPPECDVPGPYYLGIPHILPSGHIDLDHPRYIAEADFGKWTKRVVPQYGDVLFSYEATLNLYACVPKDFRCCLGRRMGLVRPDPTKLDTLYLYYYFFSPTWRKTVLEKTIVGATVDRLPIKTFPDFPVLLPPLPVQKKIASILSAYDDLIENNRRRIAILEEMARKVYRKRFGGKRGANRVSLRSFVNQTVSGDWGMESSGGRCSERIVCLRGADITSVRQRDWGKRIVRYVTQKHVEERAMRDGDLFVELSGGSPTQATGRVGLVTDEMLRDVDCPVLCTNFCRVVRPKGGYSYFLYLTWLDLYEKDVMFLYEHSAIALKNFDLDLFLDKVTVGNPATEELLKFNEDVKPLMDQMDVLGLANRRLAAARDVLLPKLMIGELTSQSRRCVYKVIRK